MGFLWDMGRARRLSLLNRLLQEFSEVSTGFYTGSRKCSVTAILARLYGFGPVFVATPGSMGEHWSLPFRLLFSFWFPFPRARFFVSGSVFHFIRVPC